MSIQRTLQTGLLIGANLQASALRTQVAKMQQLAAAQQQQQDQLGAMRQIVFEAHKLLDVAQHEIEQNPVQAVYATRIASFGLMRVDEKSFPDFSDKQELYRNQQRAVDLLAHAEPLLPIETAQDVHRLAWLQQVRGPLTALHTWLQITENIQGSAILFTPPAGFFRGLLILILGNIVGGMFAGVLFAVAHLLGFLVYLTCNGITLLIADTVLRKKLLSKCDTMARKVGGWVGPGMRPVAARQFAEQTRAQLSSWEYPTTATTANEAGKELAIVDGEITQLQQTYFPQ
jgi:hypothetical protein